MRVAKEILDLIPYQPGKPISETKRELGLETVFKLASNEHPMGVNPKVIEALIPALSELHRYPDGAAYEATRCLATHLRASPKEIVFGNGSDELIGLLLKIYCRPGEAILTSEYAFIAYQISAQAAQVKTIKSPITADFRFDLKAMAELLSRHPEIRLVFIANPNNPTGTYVNEAELREFLKASAERDVLVVVDEAYFEYVDASDYPSGLKLRAEFPHLLVLRTMSKAYGLAGLRMGYLIGPEEVVGLMHRVRVPFNLNSLAQVAFVAAMNDQEFVKKGVELNRVERERVSQALKSQGFKVVPSQTNFVLFDTGGDGQEVFKALLKRGVILRPLANYGLPRHLRMSLGLPHENDAALTALGEVM